RTAGPLSEPPGVLLEGPQLRRRLHGRTDKTGTHASGCGGGDLRERRVLWRIAATAGRGADGRSDEASRSGGGRAGRRVGGCDAAGDVNHGPAAARGRSAEGCRRAEEDPIAARRLSAVSPVFGYGTR